MSGSPIFARAAEVETPSIAATTPARLSAGRYVARVEAETPPSGWEWRVDAPGDLPVTVPAGGSFVTLHRASFGQTPVSAFLFHPATGAVGPRVDLALIYAPAAAEIAPAVYVGPLVDTVLIVGTPLVLDLTDYVTGASLRASATVDGGPLPAGWSLVGLTLTIPADAPFTAKTLTVNVGNEGASYDLIAVYSCQAAGASTLTNVTPPNFYDLGTGTATGPSVGARWRIGGSSWQGGVAPFTTETRIKRNGTVIRDWQVNYLYDIVDADKGTTLTAEMRVTDSTSPTPQTVTVNAIGSAVVPSGGSVGSVVSTTAALRTALQNAVAGDTILLAPGDYDAFNASYLKGTATTGIVTVKSNVPGTPARFPSGLMAQGSSGRYSIRGITFDNLIFGPSVQPARQAHTVLGVRSTQMDRIKFRNVLVENTLIGINIVSGCRDVTIEACEIARTQRDAIRVFAGSNANSGCSGITVRNTKIHEHAIGTDGNHPDCIQFSCNSASFHSDCLIEYNHFIEQKAASAPTGYVQGIFMNSEWLTGSSTAVSGPGHNPVVVEPHPNDYPALAFTNFIIRGNLIEADHANGIFLMGHKDLQCYGNLLKAKTQARFESNNGSTAGISVAFRNTENCRAYNNVQARASIFTTAQPGYTGRVSDFAQWGITHLSSWIDETVPTGWSNPTVGRYALD